MCSQWTGIVFSTKSQVCPQVTLKEREKLGKGSPSYERQAQINPAAATDVTKGSTCCLKYSPAPQLPLPCLSFTCFMQNKSLNVHFYTMSSTVEHLSKFFKASGCHCIRDHEPLLHFPTQKIFLCNFLHAALKALEEISLHTCRVNSLYQIPALASPFSQWTQRFNI